MLKLGFFVLVFMLLFSAVFMDRIKDFLDVFHQNDYKLVPEWAEVVRFNPRHFRQFEAHVFKYNRTCTAMNLTTWNKIDMGNDLEVTVQGFKFASNEYRPFPAVDFKINLCAALGKNVAGFQSFSKCGNFTGCPFVKNSRFHTCNWTPDQAHFPPLIPSGRYMLELSGFHRNTESFVCRAYVSVTRPEVKK